MISKESILVSYSYFFTVTRDKYTILQTNLRKQPESKIIIIKAQLLGYK